MLTSRGLSARLHQPLRKGRLVHRLHREKASVHNSMNSANYGDYENNILTTIHLVARDSLLRIART